jgi:uncharacterized RDD family membrane protein YckC
VRLSTDHGREGDSRARHIFRISLVQAMMVHAKQAEQRIAGGPIVDQGPDSNAEARQTAGQLPRAAPLEGQLPPLLYQGQPLATWGSRVVAYLFDLLFGLLLEVPGGVLVGVGAALHGGVRVALIIVGSVLLLIGVIVQIWQSGWRQGARGQSWGKSVTGLRTVSAETMRPIGGPMGLLRWLVDIILGTISILQLLNYLWPLWDARRQTWSDKVVGSVVLAR